MGCFNTVYYQCPMCNQRIREQSKAGSCTMREDHIANAEHRDVAEIEGTHKCPHCEKHYTVSLTVMPHIFEASTEEEY